MRPEDLGTFAPYLMNRIMHRYNQTVQSELAPLGLTVLKMRALAALEAQGDLTVNELTVFAVSEQSTMSRTVDQLERDGLIERTVSPQDNRVRVVSITAAGRAAHTMVWPKMRAVEAAMLEGLDEDAKSALLGSLDHILRNIRQNDF